MRTFQAMRRLFTELPQPGRTFIRCFIALFLVAFILGAVTQMRWVGLGISGAGVFLFLFGWHVFRDINGTASMWSKIYKESRGIRPEGFTFADVPTIKAMGFMYMLMGAFFAAGGVGISFS